MSSAGGNPAQENQKAPRQVSHNHDQDDEEKNGDNDDHDDETLLDR